MGSRPAMSTASQRNTRYASGGSISGAIRWKIFFLRRWKRTCQPARIDGHERQGVRMAIYRRNYTTYSGALTPAWSRCLVPFRYSRRNLFRSKLQTSLFVACFFFPAACLLMIYLSHSLSFVERLGAASQAFTIDNRFFFYFMNVQGVLSFLLTAFVGPGLISPDLANVVLTLYSPRPTPFPYSALCQPSALPRSLAA